MSLLNTYYGRQIYAREYPYLHYTNIPKNYNNLKENKLPTPWHVDHVLIANMFILLEDVAENETCMEILPGTHKYLNYPFPRYSKKAIESLSIQPIKCFGKKDTVHIHIGNTIHRLRAVPDRNRLAFYGIFTPGPNIILDCENISKCLNPNFKLENLKEENRKILSGIFPRNLDQGYELTNDAMLPTKFKGI